MTDGYKIKKVRIRQNGVEKIVRPPVPATAISLDKSSINLTTVGETSQITATLTPADSTSTVSWSSSDTSIATVSNTGLVTCVTPGSCTITATTDNGLTATCSVSNVTRLLYYSFDNQNLNDDSGHGNNGSWYNGTGSFTTGIKSYGAYLGGSHAISIPIKVPTGDFTYSLCVNISSYKNFNALLGTSEWNTGSIHFAIQSSSSITAGFHEGYSTWNLSYNGVPTLNSWHNIVMTRSGNVWTLYLDGSQIAQTTKAFTPSQSYQWYVGYEYGTSRILSGTVDEVIFEDKAWTASEVSNYYNSLK